MKMMIILNDEMMPGVIVVSVCIPPSPLMGPIIYTSHFNDALSSPSIFWNKYKYKYKYKYK